MTNDMFKELDNVLKQDDISQSSKYFADKLEKYKLQLQIYSKYYCKDCKNKDCLSYTNNLINQNVSTMFVGYKPIQIEGNSHIASYSNSGIILNTILDILRINKEKIHFTNLLKCCVDNNDEIYKCMSKYFVREIKLINPNIIVLIGEDALNTFRQFFNLKPYNDSITNKLYNFKIDIFNRNVICFCIINPKDLLNNTSEITKKLKSILWSQLKNIKKYMSIVTK